MDFFFISPPSREKTISEVLKIPKLSSVDVEERVLFVLSPDKINHTDPSIQNRTEFEEKFKFTHLNTLFINSIQSNPILLLLLLCSSCSSS